MKHTVLTASVYAAFLALLVPLAPLAIWSVASSWPWPELWPGQLGLRPWAMLLDPDSGFTSGVFHSLAIAVPVTGIALLISLPLGRVLGTSQFRGKSLLEALVIMPLLLPAFVAAMGLHETMIQWNLTDTYSGVIIAHLVPTTPYMIRTLSTGYALLGTKLEAQASTLGASPRQVYFQVTMPRLFPAMALGCTFVFLASLGEYVLTLLVGGDSVKTLPLVLYPFLTGGDRPIAAMGSLLMVAVPLFSLFVLERWLATLLNISVRPKERRDGATFDS